MPPETMEIPLEPAIVLNPLMVSPEMSITDAIACMSAARSACALRSLAEHTEAPILQADARASCLLVIDNHRLVGILTERDVVRLSAAEQSLQGAVVADVMTRNLVTLRESEFTDIFSALQLLQRHHIRHLPILGDQGQVIGLVTHETLRQLLRPVDLLRIRLVSEVMITQVVQATPETPVLEIAQLMTEHRVSSVVVVETHFPAIGTVSGLRSPWMIPVGILTEGDIVQFQALNLNFRQIQAQGVMSKPVFTVSPQDSLWAAQQWMQEKRLGRLIVAGDRDELLGIVTQSTVLQALNPIELYKLVEVLERKVCRLEAEKTELLQTRNLALTQEVQQRTQELKQQNEREQFLGDIATRIRASLELQTTLDAVVTEVQQFLQCDRVLVYQFSPDWSGRVTAEAVLPGWTSALRDVITDSCFQDKADKLYAVGKRHAIANIYEAGYPDCYLQLLEHYQVKANLVVPIIVEQKLWGLLIGHQCQAPRVWEATDLNLLDRIAVQIAIAIQQSQAYEQTQREMAERRQAEAAFQSLVEGAAAIAGENFFSDLVRYIAETLNVRYVVVATQQDNLLQSTASWLDGQMQPNVDYCIENTPCHFAAMLGEYICLQGVQAQFPTYPTLKALDAEAYIGIALTNTHKQTIGCLYIVDSKPITQPELVISMLRVFAARASAELERQAAIDALKQLNSELEDRIAQRTAELQQSEERFRQIFEQSPVGIGISDLEGQFTSVNTSLTQIIGYKKSELLQKSLQDLLATNQQQQGLKQLQALLEATLPVVMFESELISGQGETVWVNITSALIVDGFGHPSSIVHLIKDVSDRKKAEAKLLKLTSLQQAILNSTDYSIISTDSEGMIQTFNVAAERMLGYRAAELVGKSTPELIHDPAEIIQWAQNLSDALGRTIPPGFSALCFKASHGISSDEEWTYIRKDGSRFPVLLSVNALRDCQGQITGFLGIAKDITQQKQAELEFQELTLSLQNAMEGISRLDPQGRYLSLNQAYAKICGYSPEELVGQHWQLTVFPEDIPGLEAAYQIMLEQGKVEAEARGICKDGSLFYKQVTLVKALNSEGQFNGHYCFTKDISDRKATESALKSQLAAIEAAIDGIGLLEGDTYTFLNQSHVQMFGYQDATELLGKSWTMLYEPEEIERFGREVFPILTQQHFWQGEAIAKRRDGSKFNEGLSLTLTENGTLICVCRDISEQKQAEAKTRQANEQLLLANAELARATRLKDEFLANMSHELRTPLNAILGMAEGLQEQVFGATSSGQERAIATIERSGRHLLELINDILDLAKIESGKLELQIAPVSVTYLCETSLTFVRQLAIRKNIQLTSKIPSNLSDLCVDERRLRQVLINLLNNAVKFTPEGGSVRLVVTEECQDNYCQILFQVQDTGIGIAPENFSKLFQPFIQIDSSLTRQHAGTGLGLSLVQQLTQLHGGSVTVTSEVNQGSCFTVRLPYSCFVKDAAEPVLPSSETPAAEPVPLTSSKTVLLVEDIPSAAEQTTRYLAETGLQTVVHTRGQGVLEAAIALQPAFIILDLLLPDVMGWHVLTQLKAHPETQSIPVVIASVMDERSRAMALGACHYLVKPMSRTDLQAVLQSLQIPLKSVASPLPPSSEPSLSSPLILLAEDNTANVATFSSYLKNRGFQLCLAEDGAEAIALAATCHPDLILMDIQMPKVDGLTAIRQIRANPAIAHIPIIALTALAMPSDRENCLEAGANEYITKPVKLKSLVEMIYRLL